MTANTSLAKGRDPRYLTEGAGAGHAGGTRYYAEAAGEPPGQWVGAGRRPVLGLQGDVDADQLQALYMDRVAPDGPASGRAGPRPHFRPVRGARGRGRGRSSGGAPVRHGRGSWRRSGWPSGPSPSTRSRI